MPTVPDAEKPVSPVPECIDTPSSYVGLTPGESCTLTLRAYVYASGKVAWEVLPLIEQLVLLEDKLAQDEGEEPMTAKQIKRRCANIMRIAMERYTIDSVSKLRFFVIPRAGGWDRSMILSSLLRGNSNFSFLGSRFCKT